jgi:hypothetical protein
MNKTQLCQTKYLNFTTSKAFLILLMHSSPLIKKYLFIKSFINQRMHYRFALKNIKIYIKIYIKIAPTYFDLTTILREHIIRA